nr:unnamed protein product [Spirometra erinaceieuropaei]
MSRLLENPFSNVRVTNDCRGRQYNVLPSADDIESVAFRNAACGDAEQEEEEKEEEAAAGFGGGIESGLVREDETEQSGHNNITQHPKPHLRKLKFVPELEGIEEVSEEDEQEEQDCEEEGKEEEEEDEDASTNDNNGVKPEVKEGGQQQQQYQQQNMHADGDADCLPVVSESFISPMAYLALFSFTLLMLDAYTLLDRRERKPIRRRLGYLWRKFVCCGNLPASA